SGGRLVHTRSSALANQLGRYDLAARADVGLGSNLLDSLQDRFVVIFRLRFLFFQADGGWTARYGEPGYTDSTAADRDRSADPYATSERALRAATHGIALAGVCHRDAA